MQAVSSLPWANTSLVCFEESLLLWLRGVAAWWPLEHCACHFSFSLRLQETLEGAAHILFGKAWSKHKLLFISFLDIQDCFALILSRDYLVVISCWYCDVAINYVWVEITSASPEVAEGPQKSTGWPLGCSLHFFCSHSNKYLQPLMADQQGILGTSAVRFGSHSGSVDKRGLNRSFQMVIFIQCKLKLFVPLTCLLWGMYATSL